MPPKSNKDGAKAAAKAKVEKAKQAAADKTFGLKNKSKSKVVQQYVQQVSKGAEAAAKAHNLANTAAERKKKKEQEEAAAREMANLFAPAIKQPKPPPGVDPKSIVCEHFRHGQCTKGHKCKYSHDLNVERKTAKAALYDEEEGKEEGMEDWDQETLEKAIAQKHGTEKPSNATDIICKYFLDAVEKRMYGWFWQCPNGKECKYRHKLPPGFKLKSEIKELLASEAANKPSLEEEIEAQRQAVEARTPITEQTFAQWHSGKAAAKCQAAEDAAQVRRRNGALTGREIFQQEGFEAEDDIGARDDYTREVDEEAAFQKAQEEALAANRRANTSAAGAGASSSSAAPDAPAASESVHQNGHAGPTAAASAVPAESIQLSKEEEDLFDDDDLDDDELDEIERGLDTTSLG